MIPDPLNACGSLTSIPSSKTINNIPVNVIPKSNILFTNVFIIVA